MPEETRRFTVQLGDDDALVDACVACYFEQVLLKDQKKQVDSDRR